jgi:MFS family permease
MASPVPAAAMPSLWRNRPYMSLLTGETIQGFGVEIAQVAIPIIAVTYLVATESQVGMLAAAEGIAFLLLALPVGAWVDRVSRRRVMVWANVARALIMATIPMLWFTHVLTVNWLMVGALLISGAAVFFDMAYMSIVPSLVPHAQLDVANSRLQTTAETARAAGPGIGGLLAKIISAAWLPLAATVGYLASAVSIWRIPADEPPPRAHDASIFTEIREGLSFVFHHPFIRPLVLSTAVSNLFGNVAYAMFPVLLLRHLNLGPFSYGLVLTAGAVGGVAGALIAPLFIRRFGEGHAIPATYIFGSIPMFLPALSFLASRHTAIVMVAVSMFLGSVGIVSFNVVQVSMRQRQCPPRMLGRMTASIRTVIWGVGPIGAIASGVVATHLGLATAFWIGAIGNAAGVLFLVFSPLWRMRDVPVVASGAYEAADG